MQVDVSIDKPVMTQEMWRLLKPIWIEVQAVKNLPNEKDLPSKSQGVYVYAYGVLSATTMSLVEETG